MGNSLLRRHDWRALVRERHSSIDSPRNMRGILFGNIPGIDYGRMVDFVVDCCRLIVAMVPFGS